MYNERKRFNIMLSLLICLTVVLGAIPFSVFAADESDTVKVGYYENEVFQEGAKEGAVKTGYAYEYYLKLSEYTGWKYEYIYGSYNELYNKLLKGEIDLLAADNDVSPDPTTLSGKKIGVLKSAIADTLNKYLAQHKVNSKVVLFDDYEELFKAFDDKKLDILAAEGDGAHGRSNTEVVCSFGSSDYYLCVNIKRKDLITKLNSAQAELLADEPNYLNSLRTKYYPSSISSHAFSAAEKEWIASSTTLKVGYLNDYQGYTHNPLNSPNWDVKRTAPKRGEVYRVVKYVQVPGGWNVATDHEVLYEGPQYTEAELLEMYGMSKAQGYFPEREFYEPDELDLASATPDFRNLLQWRPAVLTDENGVVEIPFAASDVNTEFVGLVEAVDGTGLLGCQMFTFRVVKL